MNDQERARLLAAISELTTMLEGVLQMLKGILDGCEEGRHVTAAQVSELRDHAQQWSSQIARLKNSTASAAIKPPERLQRERPSEKRQELEARGWHAGL